MAQIRLLTLTARNDDMWLGSSCACVVLRSLVMPRWGQTSGACTTLRVVTYNLLLWHSVRQERDSDVDVERLLKDRHA